MEKVIKLGFDILILETANNHTIQSKWSMDIGPEEPQSSNENYTIKIHTNPMSTNSI